MAQALINRPPILLMDESFSALDAQTRALMEEKLLELWHELKAIGSILSFSLSLLFSWRKLFGG
jgi:ABC-type nitrate/sulfonate/bicarbonate transport system ATPase subunit